MLTVSTQFLLLFCLTDYKKGAAHELTELHGNYQRLAIPYGAPPFADRFVPMSGNQASLLYLTPDSKPI